MVSDSDPIHALEAELAFTRVEGGDARDPGPQRRELALERRVAERRHVDRVTQLFPALAGPALRVITQALRLGLRPALRIVEQ